MIRSAKPAHVLYYFDADVLGLAKIMVQLRRDSTYPGDPGGPVRGRRVRPACSVTDPETDDEVWIPETARHGWLIITRDRHIQDNRREIEAVRDNGARMITLAGAEATTTFDQMEVLMSNWRAIEDKLEEAGPFIYTATRTGGLVRVPLT
jgi:PIN like domain